MHPIARQTIYVIVLLIASSSAAAQVYVDDNAPGTNDGTSWSNAYTDLQDALDDPRASKAEIWVAAGTYSPTRLRDPIDERSATFIASNGDFQMYGGFIGTETHRYQRNPQENKTVLSGDIDQNDITDKHGITKRVSDQRGDNAYRLMHLNGRISDAKPITSATVMDGIVISGGNSNLSTGNENTGGILCDATGEQSECSPQIRDVEFIGNFGYTGGAFFATTSRGGTSNLTLEKVTFQSNEGKTGGALSIGCKQSTKCNVFIRDANFNSNNAECCGGGIGGAISVSSASSGSTSGARSHLYISDSAFEFNKAGSGGAIHFYGGGDSSQSKMTIERSRFGSNYASSGGAVTITTFQTTTDVSVEDVEFIENEAIKYGGAVYERSTWGGTSHTKLDRVRFVGNSATFEHADSRGGALYIMARESSASRSELMNVVFYGNYADLGGAIHSHGLDGGWSQPVVVNSTIVSNSAEYGGALFTDGFDNGKATPTILNSILWQNSAVTSGNEVFNRDGEPTLAFSIVENSNGSPGWDDSLGLDGGNNIDSDPKFINFVPADSVDSREVNLDLEPESPAIDQGDTTEVLSKSDHNRGARVTGSAVDIGAFEWGSIFSDSF